MIKFAIIAIFLFAFNPLLSTEKKFFTLEGVVLSEEDGEPLRSVTVRVADEIRGTYTNSQGKFKLEMERGSHQVIFSMIGREKYILKIDLKNDVRDLVVKLKTNPALLNAIEVIAEDPGTRLMRKVIQKKIQQKSEIQSYKYLLYTKFVTQTDTITAGRADKKTDSTIFSIFETYSIGYFAKPDKYFNEIIQRRQSVNVPPQANFVTFGTNLNIYDDFISILGEEIYTPFHLDAPDFYDFILDTNFVSDEYAYGDRIIVIPKSDFRKLFSGFINIDPEKMKPISVELYPNIAVRLPFNTKVKIIQTFHQEPYVMPKYLQIKTTSNANLLGIIQPRLDVSLETYATNFEYNIKIDNDIFNLRRVEASKKADKFDSLFWTQHQFIPLSKDELEAYDAIRAAREAPDSVQSTNIFTKYLAPINQQLSKLNRKPFTGWEDMLVYNTIKGFNPTISVKDFIFEKTELLGKLGYGFADKKFNFHLGTRIFFDEYEQYSIQMSAFNSLVRSDNPYIVRTSSITLTSLTTGYDYGDYYYGYGANLEFYAGFGQLRFIRRNYLERPVVFKFALKSEIQKNAQRNSNFSIFRNSNRRPNPPIIEGKINSIATEFNWNFNRERRLSNNGFLLAAEISNKNILKSDFNYYRFEFVWNYRQKTFPLSYLDIRFNSGMLLGDKIPQKFFSIESSTSVFSANTSLRGIKEKEFYGNKYVTLSLEHNWGEIIPGLIRIPNIAEFGIEFVTYFNSAWSRFDKDTKFASRNGALFIPNSTDVTNDRLYYEFGLGLNRLLIFFRTDITVRLTQVERPQIILTFTNANF